jgi:hypothetical protein
MPEIRLILSRQTACDENQADTEKEMRSHDQTLNDVFCT